ncbi:MAG: helix-turn-helix domain-containing protein [Candidatus Omnitrophica bacterium]|nr:helix-turn-helix domain-containing protein [Candidatus Omnitrophota bacterium]
MLREIFERYQTGIPGFPPLRRPRVGAAIREIRTNRGQRQMDFAGTVKINPSTFKSFENDHQKATTVENLDRCAASLKTATEDLILLGREYDPSNFFVMKRPEDIPEIKGLRKRKHVPEDWFQTVRFTMKDFDVTPLSPPINAKKDFFICRLGLPPKKRIENLDLGTHNPIVTYIADGFNLEVAYAGKNHKLTSGQAFMLDGYFRHTIVNHDEDHTAVIYLVTKIPKPVPSRHVQREPRQEPLPINIAKGVDAIRRHVSGRSQKPLSLRHLAALTDTLNERQINEIIRLKQGSSVVYGRKSKTCSAPWTCRWKIFCYGLAA